MVDGTGSGIWQVRIDVEAGMLECWNAGMLERANGRVDLRW